MGIPLRISLGFLLCALCRAILPPIVLYPDPCSLRSDNVQISDMKCATCPFLCNSGNVIWLAGGLALMDTSAVTLVSNSNVTAEDWDPQQSVAHVQPTANCIQDATAWAAEHLLVHKLRNSAIIGAGAQAKFLADCSALIDRHGDTVPAYCDPQRLILAPELVATLKRWGQEMKFITVRGTFTQVCIVWVWV